MTQYYIDADNGDDTHSGLNTAQTASVVITSSDVDDSVLTAAVHGLTTGDFVNISGHGASTPDINGANQQITVVDTTNFTIDGVDITVGSTGGTVQEEDGPWANLDQFTENARSAGDIATLRRGTTAQYDDGTDLNFTSDGALGNSIVIEADFDDSWTDDANSTQTYTMVFGSKTHTASATITGVSVGDWVYNTTDADNPREFSYEVGAVSGTTLTLKLPWKGSTGATKTLRVMPAAPVWNTLTAIFQMNLDGDDYWKFQGLEATGSDTSGVIELNSSKGIEVYDCIIKPDVVDAAFESSGDVSPFFKKCRILGQSSSIGMQGVTTSNDAYFTMEDCLIESCAEGVRFNRFCAKITDTEFLSNTDDISFINAIGPSIGGAELKMRNCLLGASSDVVAFHSSSPNCRVLMEDFNGTLNSTRQYHGVAAADGDIVLQSDTGTVRSGGNNISIKILPSTNMTENFFFTKLRLFEIPIYATTASKTYTIYWKSNSDTWTVDPTAAELWIELEAWGHASNNVRKITKSTSTIDGSLTTWQALAVTVAPAQAGVAYLRGWYAKSKEAGTNEFYIDPLPVVS